MFIIAWLVFRGVRNNGNVGSLIGPNDSGKFQVSFKNIEDSLYLSGVAKISKRGEQVGNIDVLGFLTLGCYPPPQLTNVRFGGGGSFSPLALPLLYIYILYVYVILISHDL